MKTGYLQASVCAFLVAAVCGCSRHNNNVTNQESEYLAPIHPGSSEGSGFWNTYAVKFIYAPSFNVPNVESAHHYVFSVSPEGGINDKEYRFESDVPTASLAPIWESLPVGGYYLTVEAVDRDNQVISPPFERDFQRDFPFDRAEIHPAFRPCGESARYCLQALHGMTFAQWWKGHTVPDPTFRHNSYPCKIISATIGLEALTAQVFPSLKEEALGAARNAAQFLMDIAQPAGAPLAHFPPTYYNNAAMTSAAKLADNRGTTMTMEACSVADAFLTLYKACGERQYFDFALDIMRTYASLQRPDGSFPIKVNYATGAPLLDVCAMPHPIILTVARLRNEFGVTEFDDMAFNAEQWMARVPLTTFDFTGQFEDVSVNGLEPYENLTYVAAAMYGEYLLYELKEGRTHGASLEQALDLVRFCEDQFVHWDWLPAEDGIRHLPWPSVCEQYKYQVPVDDACATVARAFLAAYSTTGNPRWKAKAEALLATLTNVQNKVSGLIITDWYEMTAEENYSLWPNCAYKSINALLLYETYYGEGSALTPSLTPQNDSTLVTFLVSGGGA
ncbi:MAG: hypothetical protein HUJ91_00610 [Bacteroidales bacterium]|nr:hypothetical protein [Bacteroidales bacterium]